MLNFRKLRQDFSSSILKEGKELFDKGLVISAKILSIDGDSLRIGARVRGAFENVYECEIEVDRVESHAIDSNCDCTYTYDCQHIAAFLFYLEAHLNEILVNYSKESDIEKSESVDEDVKKQLKETFEVAAAKEGRRKDAQYQKEVLSEYIRASTLLGNNPFFLPIERIEEDKAELAVIFNSQSQEIFDHKNSPEVQLALRLPFRSKPLYVPNAKAFLDAVRYKEPIQMGGRKFFFSSASFDTASREILNMLITSARFHGVGEEKYLRLAQLDVDALGAILASAYDLAAAKALPGTSSSPLPCLFCGNIEEPLCYSNVPAEVRFGLEYIEVPHPVILLKSTVCLDEEQIRPEEALLFESVRPGLVHKNTYYRFHPKIKRVHLKHLSAFHDLAIPEPLFGSFIENAMPVLRTYAEVQNPGILSRFVTLPYVEPVKGRCEISYLSGELEAKFFFIYDGKEVPAATSLLAYKHISLFVSEQGILARNLVEERKLIEEIFQDFLIDEKEGLFRVKSEKKIVEFMTEVIPKNQHRVKFECPENLSDQFIYDESTFELHCKESTRVDSFEVNLKVNGFLQGTSLDLLWECIAAKKRFLELPTPSAKVASKKGKAKIPRILVLDLEKITPLVQIFDEIGIKKLEDHTDYRPLWSLTTLNAAAFADLPVSFSISKPLLEIQRQILGESPVEHAAIPHEIQASLRNYQLEGVQWLGRLRSMHLNGILADDMGLGKTLQAIIAVTQSKTKDANRQSLIVCPTSLVYNWKEEFSKFNPGLKVQVVDSTPHHRKKLLKDVSKYDVVVTSYNLLQKDIDIYGKHQFDYLILDEAQHIKNRGTRNAKSVKQVQAAHRLILTGTPIENSLDELWSLFDFLMPGLLSTYDRFLEKYIRQAQVSTQPHMEVLRRKVAPFILRRMKEDVLADLPPVSEIVYHCNLTDAQRELYNSYAASAKEELQKLVKKDGFDKIHIHVLATLTRLKQICCHPAIFAKESAEEGDSAKYDMLMELIPSLIEGGHKTVIFSQYTKMLGIMRNDFEQRGIPFAYLDGSSKNRLEIVKQFNEDPKIPVFLVSLKAGGAGLNLVGADTVIHYDMWWNPAVENQATDRVHRMGQKKSVSSYKLVTLNTIEEKILQLQNRKMGLVKQVINSDDETIAKLTWEEVLELLQT